MDTNSGIPFGIASKTGLGSAAVLFIFALYAALTDKTTQTTQALGSATVILVTVLLGRYGQAIKKTGTDLRPISGAVMSTTPGQWQSGPTAHGVSAPRAVNDDDEPDPSEDDIATALAQINEIPTEVPKRLDVGDREVGERLKAERAAR